ncbi:MAG: DEAD/DEAH box helicase [Sandaracinus sp.]
MAGGRAEHLLELLTGDELREFADHFGALRGGNRSVLISRIERHVRGNAEKLVRSGAWTVDGWRAVIGERTERNVARGWAGIAEYLATAGAVVSAPTPASAQSERLPPFRVVETGIAPPDRLRPYQEEAVQRLHGLQPGRGAILCHPTGSGKTKTAIWWLLSLLANNGGRALWLAGRTELIGQAAEDIARHAALLRPRGPRFTLRIVEGGADRDLDGDIVVASIDTLARRGITAADVDRAGVVDTIVYDEAHHAPARTYAELLRDLRADRRRLLGLSATPIRTAPSERPVLTGIFPGGIIHQKSYVELMNLGVLAYPQHKVVTLDGTVDVSEAQAQYVATHGRLPPALESKLARDEPRAQRVANEILKLRAELSPMIVFAVGREDARRVRDLLVQRGMRAEYLDGETKPALRKELLDRLRSESLDALVNVEVLTEGTDVPNLRGVVIARPTFSETLYRQMIGRGSRRTATKTTFTVLDFQDNFSRFADHLASRFALAAEISEPTVPAPGAEQPAPTAAPTSARLPEVPAGVLQAWRVAVAEMLRSADASAHVEVSLAGWWTWREPTHDEYMLVFEHERELVNGCVEEIGRRVANLHPSQNSVAGEAATWLYNERLFATTVAWRKFEELGRAVHANRGVRYEPFRLDSGPDLGDLYRQASAVVRMEAWLLAQYDAHPAWALHYPTRDSFVATVLAVGERAASNDTVRDDAFVASASIASEGGVDVEMMSCGPNPASVVHLLMAHAGLSQREADAVVGNPGALVAYAWSRERAEMLSAILQRAGATVRVRSTE